MTHPHPLVWRVVLTRTGEELGHVVASDYGTALGEWGTLEWECSAGCAVFTGILHEPDVIQRLFKLGVRFRQIL